MKTRRKTIFIGAVVLLVLSLIIYFELPNINVFWEDLHSGNTIAMLEFGKYKLQHGDISGINYIYYASLRAIEFRKHRRAAEPLIEEYYNLFQQGDYENALIACEKARTALGSYDDEGGIAYECTKTKNILEKSEGQ